MFNEAFNKLGQPDEWDLSVLIWVMFDLCNKYLRITYDNNIALIMSMTKYDQWLRAIGTPAIHLILLFVDFVISAHYDHGCIKGGVLHQ